MLIVITGESGCGKSTVQKELEKMGYPKLVTDTTRPPRPGEADGVDYNFREPDEFVRKEAEVDYVESASYRGWRYGTGYDACVEAAGIRHGKPETDAVAALTPAGWRAIRRSGVPCFVAYLKTDRRERLIKTLRRGDDVEEAYRRSLSDVGQFDAVEAEVDAVVENPTFDRTPAEIAEEILAAAKRAFGR